MLAVILTARFAARRGARRWPTRPAASDEAVPAGHLGGAVLRRPGAEPAAGQAHQQGRAPDRAGLARPHGRRRLRRGPRHPGGQRGAGGRQRRCPAATRCRPPTARTRSGRFIFYAAPNLTTQARRLAGEDRRVWGKVPARPTPRPTRRRPRPSGSWTKASARPRRPSRRPPARPAAAERKTPHDQPAGTPDPDRAASDRGSATAPPACWSGTGSSPRSPPLPQRAGPPIAVRRRRPFTDPAAIALHHDLADELRAAGDANQWPPLADAGPAAGPARAAAARAPGGPRPGAIWPRRPRTSITCAITCWSRAPRCPLWGEAAVQMADLQRAQRRHPPRPWIRDGRIVDAASPLLARLRRAVGGPGAGRAPAR